MYGALASLDPPELEMLGLPDALRERAADLSGIGVNGLEITVDVPATLPVLPAAMEVAVYYGARGADQYDTSLRGHPPALRLRVKDAASVDAAVLEPAGRRTLELEICDDGRGLEETQARAGVAGRGSDSYR